LVTIKKKCYVNYLGCEKRKLDAQRVINYLRANGYSLASESADADVIVFLTCAFCNKYEDFSVAKLDKIYRQKKPTALMIVGGCLPAINPNRLASYSDAIQIQARDLDAIDSLLQSTVPVCSIADPNTTIFDQKGTIKLNESGFKSPAEIKYEEAKKGYKIRINWGCLGRCAYCVTRFAEKTLTSKPLDEILRSFQQGLDAGYTSFLFTGGDTGGYGLDLGTSIVNLLEHIFANPGNYTVNFHDFGVQWLCSNFSKLLPVFQANQDKLGCFCFPIQSGSNRILRLMRRSYTAEMLYAVLLPLKHFVPSIKIGTHFIVGFPGETDEDFELSAQMLREIPFDFVEVYRYADHTKADSTSLPNKVSPEVILQRNATLEDIFRKKFAA
jgi:MiaB/RimO family radical SAM methylthiotransferase